ncbi:MAG: hypothetical protein WBG26_01490, partial [Candidatus Binataceae bacterium]
ALDGSGAIVLTRGRVCGRFIGWADRWPAVFHGRDARATITLLFIDILNPFAEIIHHHPERKLIAQGGLRTL